MKPSWCFVVSTKYLKKSLDGIDGLLSSGIFHNIGKMVRVKVDSGELKISTLYGFDFTSAAKSAYVVPGL